MSQSSFSRLLSLFESSSGALSIRFLARELEVSTERVKGMVDFWVQKGVIRVSSAVADCGSCGVKGDCSLILNIPKTYELVTDTDKPGIAGPPCGSV